MYTEQDLQAIQAQQKKRWTVLFIPCVLCLAVIIAGAIIRIEWLTAAATIVMGAALIAGWDLFIKPLHRYEIHLKNVLHGITHELEGDFDRFDLDASMVDGVKYYGMTIICLDDKQKPFERLFYFDAEKEKPSFTKGERVRVVYHDRELANVQAV